MGNNFTPDEELIQLATDFSNNYKTIPVGDYFSSKKESCSGNRAYQIRYVNSIIDHNGVDIFGNIAFGNIINGKTLILIDLSRNHLLENQYSSDFVYNYIIDMVTIVFERDLLT
jgi:hypothetical protein